MIEANDFIRVAKELGFKTWSGVPCSFLTPFINSVIDDPEMSYISSANEGDAVATATGAALAGQRAVALMQNSGLGNAISPLSSLNWVFRIPVLLIVTLRGEPGLPDEPQHELMGQITGKLLNELQISWDWFPRDSDSIEGAFMVASRQMEKSGLPYALIMRKGSVAPAALESQWQASSRPSSFESADCGAPQMTRQQALCAVVDHTPEDESVVVGTTGYTGRELFAIADRPNQLYMVGSMGCASSLGLGLSLALPQQQVLVADGDGAAMMRMGNLATIGAYGRENFRHLVLDNAMHESTGGQATVSSAISFAGVASACGYHDAAQAVDPETLQRFLQEREGPSLLQLKLKPGVPEDLPRPDVSPIEVKQRLMHHLGIEAPWLRL